jgi:hypothetical protein
MILSYQIINNIKFIVRIKSSDISYGALSVNLSVEHYNYWTVPDSSGYSGKSEAATKYIL